jgi:citronellol/citronellal dehydrogenase
MGVSSMLGSTDGAETKRLEGQVAIVTGASRGIGREIAKLFALQGAHVVLAARTAASGDSKLAGGVTDAADEIRAMGGRADYLITDLTREVDREALVAYAAHKAGPPSILVNNAAVTYFGPVVGFQMKQFDLMFEVQVRAPFRLCQLASESMVEHGRGWILNISSIVSRPALVPPRSWHEDVGGTVYGMCKAALERLSTGLAAEMYGKGVAVNSLAPNRVVPTPGTVFHGLTTEDDPEAEPSSVMSQAALELCSGDPMTLSGLNACSQDLLDTILIERRR